MFDDNVQTITMTKVHPSCIYVACLLHVCVQQNMENTDSASPALNLARTRATQPDEFGDEILVMKVQTMIVQEIRESEKRLEARIVETDRRAEARLVESDRRAEARTAASEKRLGERIDKVDNTFDARFNRLESFGFAFSMMGVAVVFWFQTKLSDVEANVALFQQTLSRDQTPKEKEVKERGM